MDRPTTASCPSVPKRVSTEPVATRSYVRQTGLPEFDSPNPCFAMRAEPDLAQAAACCCGEHKALLARLMRRIASSSTASAVARDRRR